MYTLSYVSAHMHTHACAMNLVETKILVWLGGTHRWNSQAQLVVLLLKCIVKVSVIATLRVSTAIKPCYSLRHAVRCAQRYLLRWHRLRRWVQCCILRLNSGVFAPHTAAKNLENFQTRCSSTNLEFYWFVFGLEDRGEGTKLSQALRHGKCLLGHC